jgi:hypothetical protein
MEQHLHALVIKLIAQQAGVLPGSVGELAHAAFYAAVQAVDPVLSTQMHDAQGRSAFSLSPLYGRVGPIKSSHKKTAQDKTGSGRAVGRGAKGDLRRATSDAAGGGCEIEAQDGKK